MLIRVFILYFFFQNIILLDWPTIDVEKAFPILKIEIEKKNLNVCPSISLKKNNKLEKWISLTVQILLEMEIVMFSFHLLYVKL